MPTIRKSALLEVPVELAYAVVADVEAYPEFLPSCDGVQVLSRADDVIRARVEVSGMGLAHAFVTKNKHTSTGITMSLVEGPFERLEGQWSFTAISDLGCRIEVAVDFKVGGLLGSVFAPMADQVADKLVQAFCLRIEAVQT